MTTAADADTPTTGPDRESAPAENARGETAPESAAAPRPLEVRRPELALDASIPRHWYGDQAFASHFLNALSSTFPDGEAFFVRSVQHYRHLVTDPALKRAVAAFAGQEGQHSRQHARHLELLEAQGYTGIGTRNRFMRFGLRLSNRYAPRASLAGTAALEHLTALLARQILADDARFTRPMDPRMAALFQWHALEEAEHKAVAFDVMELAGIGHAYRVVQMALNTVGLFFEALDRTIYMLWKDGLLFRRRTWREGFRWLFGRGGFLHGLGPDYRLWFRRGFHPDDVDDGPLIAVWQERVAAAAIR